MVRVTGIIPVGVCGVVNQVVFHDCFWCIDRYNTITCYIVYIVAVDHNVATADPFAVSCVLISGIAACSANQSTACPYAFHVDCFMAYSVYFVSFNGKVAVFGFYRTGMIASGSGYYNDQSAGCFVCAACHLTVDIMNLVVSYCNICKVSLVLVFHYQTR